MGTGRRRVHLGLVFGGFGGVEASIGAAQGRDARS